MHLQNWFSYNIGVGLNLVRKGILAIITETMRAIFGHDGYLSSSVGVKELGTEINTTPYTLFESIMWYLGYRNKGKDNQKALFDQFSGITQAHNTVTLILLFVAAQQPFWVWAGFFKILFRTFFWVAKTTVASLGVVASTTTGPLGSKGVNAVVKLFDTMEKEILALITELEKSGDSVLTFIRRFLLIFKPIYLNTMAVRNTIYVMQQWWDQVFGCLLKNLLFGPADTKDTNCCLAKFRKEIKDIDADKKDEEEMNKINRQFDLAKERIEKQDKYAYETQVEGDYYGKKVATAFMKPHWSRQSNNCNEPCVEILPEHEHCAGHPEREDGRAKGQRVGPVGHRHPQRVQCSTALTNTTRRLQTRNPTVSTLKDSRVVWETSHGEVGPKETFF